MTGRPRTSTLVISGLFLAVLALYFLVRPDPVTRPASADQGATSSSSSAAPTSSATRTSPRPNAVAQPVAHAEPFTDPDQQFPDAGRLPDDGAVRPQPVAVRQLAHAVTQASRVRSAGRRGRSPTG